MRRQFDSFVSTIDDAPVSWFVYSAFSFYGARHDFTLPGTWVVRALAEAGRESAAVRQTLFRLEREGEFTAEKRGRVKYYSPTPYARAEIEAGTAKILHKAPVQWDGCWTVVHLHFGQAHRTQRMRMESLLAVEGFGALDRDTYVHPHPVGARIQNALDSVSRKRVVVMRGCPLSGEAMTDIVPHLWRVAETAARYRANIRAMTALSALLDRGFTQREAFLLRFALVFRHLRVAWEDPELPPTVLPADWPGDRARELAAQLYTRLLPDAVRHADQLMKQPVGRSS